MLGGGGVAQIEVHKVKCDVACAAGADCIFPLLAAAAAPAKAGKPAPLLSCMVAVAGALGAQYQESWASAIPGACVLCILYVYICVCVCVCVCLCV